MENTSQAEKYFATTHEVENQAHALENYNVYTSDIALQEAVKREGGAWAENELNTLGAASGTPERILLGFQANANKPVFRPQDHYGRRIDQVDFHPSYHELMRIYREENIHALPWTNPRQGAHVVRTAKAYLHSQVEVGHGCPGTMVFACVPALKNQPDLAKKWLPLITNEHYDPRNIPAHLKKGVTVGMAMTEKQGGTDVRANSTRAYPVSVGGPGQEYELVGHKYFVSGPMGDIFLVLAQTENGISCFLVPRWRPDGTKNPMQILQLKDKMGNISNASSETELRGALGWMIGDEGKGIKTILDMVSLTRFDCMLGSSAMMRSAISQITHHCSQRKAFGKRLVDQPLMQNVLADLAIESEAALAFTMRMARSLDNAGMDEHEDNFMRMGTAVGKYWICKRAPGHAYEAMECIGGSAVMETSMMPRLYREAPINAIWEGCGNVQALDVLRAMSREPASMEAFLTEVNKGKGADKTFDKFVLGLENEFADLSNMEYRARHIVEKMGLAIQGSLLIQNDNQLIAEAFCASRLRDNGYLMYGTMPTDIDCKAIVDRATPKVDWLSYE